MKASEIRNRETLRAWLRERPQQDSVAIAHRVALRTFPRWGAAMDRNWARQSDVTALSFLRCALISAVGAEMPEADIERAAYAADAAVRVAGQAADANSSSGAYATRAAVLAAGAATAAADSVFTVTRAVARAANYAADAATARAAVGVATGAAEAFADCRALEAGRALRDLPLWSETAPGWFAHEEQLMFQVWKADPPARWDFWRRWWEGAKTGKPIDPALQLAIVLGVDDETWQDPDATAVRIAQIEEQHQLLLAVLAVKEQLTQARAEVASARHRSHNQPPELIEEAETAAKMVTILWEPLEAAEEELEKPNPDPSRLKVIGAWLVKAAKEVLAYCGKVGDAFAMKAAETLGETGAKWAVRGTFLVVAENSTGIGQRLLDLAEKLLPYAN